jgi:hypothetical protein
MTIGIFKELLVESSPFRHCPIHVTLQCIVASALKKHKKETQFSKRTFSNILLFYLDEV